MISFSSPYILFYSFVVSLIVYNSEFVHPFSVQCNRYRFLSRSQFSTISKSKITQIYSDSEEGYIAGEDEKIFNDDLDDEVLFDDDAIEGGDDDDDMDDDDVEDEDFVEGDGSLSNSWQERRQYMNAERDRKAAAVRERE